MDPFAFPPLTALLDGAYSLLLSLATALEPLAGSASAAAAVVLVTLIVRVLLIPVGVSQAKAEQQRARLTPHLRALQKKHKKNPERLQREMMALYREHNTSPFAGMLPVLAQAPVIGILYTLFLRTKIAGHPNELLTQNLFGAPLGESLLGMLFTGTLPGASTLVVWGVMLAVVLVVADITRRVFRPVASDDSTLSSPTMLRVMSSLHYLTAVFAVFVPLAAALYLAVTVTWTLVQRMLLRRRYPLPQPALSQG